MSEKAARREHESNESDTGQLPGTGNADERPPRAPRWVKMSAIIAAALVLAIVVVLLVIGGEHGPDRHGPGEPQEQEIGPEDDAEHDPSDRSH